MTPRGEGTPRRWTGVLYWTFVGLLLVFGFLALFSYGMPFLATGATLSALWAYRRQPAVFWPVLAAELAFFVGFILVSPAGCTAGSSTTSATSAGDGGFTRCSNALGLDYSGPGTYNPPLWPAALAGLGLAVIVGTLTRAFLRRPSQPASV